MDGNTIVVLLVALGGVAVGIIVYALIRKKAAADKLGRAKAKSEQILDEARIAAENTLKAAQVEAKDVILQAKADFEAEAKEARKEIKQLEARLVQKEENLDRKAEQLDKKEGDVAGREKGLVKREQKMAAQEEQAQQLLEARTQELERIAGLTAEQAKDTLVQAMESEARHEGAKLIKRIEMETNEIADKKAKEIISTAIQRYAGDYVAEKTVSVVDLPSEEMKGRIIGREGRNIRALEAATGIDLIVDDTPEAVILSGFNPVRREVARLSLLRLIADGRIHPARIEEVVKKVENEVENTIRESGEQATFDLGVHGIHPELIKYLGRLKYRTSYAQNMLQHSIEVGFLCGIMASELNLNVKQARRAGLLHDIGKAVDHEEEGPHALIGQRLCKKCGESPKIIHAVGAHHEDIPPSSVLAVLVQAADGLSGARPGARREMFESYIKRLEDLEKIANSFEGVGNTFAIQAGRELRIIVQGEKITDEQSVLLARDVAKKIEDSLTFPGQIKVCVIRETRAVSYASK
ncbi:metal dependent phosphohydrolase [Desulfatibacillum alkenivorans DSM 16219]|jgi:ribonuclease Y|uniref:Ribonuclease Y n=1 Tax=Desulfatibacillum alkenivorans DSM 16219 TaxID=1121393 RepID=A0A1M6JPW6_9BACT|nr:ribonuclease Y [Desulfatibacillum alkenivorans]SHJ48694.1 metal dependent phosphohydrolase [Desulfatibacillum alkenivorans DSM 16219]